MLRAAVEAAAQSPNRPLLLGVTVLTSLSDADMAEIGVTGNVLNQVLRLGALARNAGCGGLVASAQEARELRRELGEGFAIVTPGVRPAGSAVGDQSRVVTPADAIAAGATHVVVGRPILEAADRRNSRPGHRRRNRARRRLNFPLLLRHQRTHIALDDPLQRVLCDFQIIAGLRVQPEARTGVEIASQPQGGIGSDAPPPVNDLRNPGHRNVQVERQPVHAEAERLHEIFAQNLTGMNGYEFFRLWHKRS